MKYRTGNNRKVIKTKIMILKKRYTKFTKPLAILAKNREDPNK